MKRALLVSRCGTSFVRCPIALDGSEPPVPGCTRRQRPAQPAQSAAAPQGDAAATHKATVQK